MSIRGKTPAPVGRQRGVRRVLPLRMTFEGTGFERDAQPVAPEPGQGFPVMSITQDEDNLYLRAEVTGIEPAELSISADWQGVSLAGKRRLPRGSGEERGFGFFDCTVALPAEVDAERADAGYCKGILTLTFPKARDRKPQLS
jgi:HSP20 family protein